MQQLKENETLIRYRSNEYNQLSNRKKVKVLTERISQIDEYLSRTSLSEDMTKGLVQIRKELAEALSIAQELRDKELQELTARAQEYVQTAHEKGEELVILKNNNDSLRIGALDTMYLEKYELLKPTLEKFEDDIRRSKMIKEIYDANRDKCDIIIKDSLVRKRFDDIHLTEFKVMQYLRSLNNIYVTLNFRNEIIITVKATDCLEAHIRRIKDGAETKEVICKNAIDEIVKIVEENEKR